MNYETYKQQHKAVELEIKKNSVEALGCRSREQRLLYGSLLRKKRSLMIHGIDAWNIERVRSRFDEIHEDIDLNEPFLESKGDLYLVCASKSVTPCCQKECVQVMVGYNSPHHRQTDHASSALLGWNVEHSLQRNYAVFRCAVTGEKSIDTDLYPCSC